jgi:hypothetical protein
MGASGYSRVADLDEATDYSVPGAPFFGVRLFVELAE